jgi:ubiquinone/menaquinone biosynthesis C-methylase UbiE
MSHSQEIREYNHKLYKVGLVDELVENTDWLPVKDFFSKADAKGKDILDIGCATGALASRLAEEKCGWKHYHGIDLTPEYVDQFDNRKIPNAEAEEGDATNLSKFNDSSKDVILLLFVLQHLSEAEGRETLKQMRRIARDNAQILIGLTVNSKRIEARKRYVSEKAKREAGATDVWVFIWNEQELLKTLGSLCFEIVSIERIPGWREEYPKLYISVCPKK